MDGLAALRAGWPPLPTSGGPALPVADVGPVALFHDDERGTIGLTLSGLTVSGLDSFAPGALGADDASGEFRASGAFPALVLRGRYVVTADAERRETVAVLDRLVGAAGDDDRLDLARRYRDRLNASPDGTELVATYYEHNDAMNDICTGKNVFTDKFPTMVTTYGGQSVTSPILADRTAAAARNPDDPAHAVGDTVYRMHSFTMQVLFAHACQAAYDKTQDPRYLDAGTASTNFKTVVTQDGPPGAVTVDEVMRDVADGPPNRARAVLAGRATPERLGYQAAEDASPVAAAAAAAAAEAIADWERSGEPTLMPWELPAGLGPRLAEGSVEAVVALRPVAVTGTAGTGDAGAVEVTAVDALPVPVDLALDGEGVLLDEVRAALGRAAFVRDLLGVRVRDAVGGAAGRAYLRELVAAAVAVGRQGER